MPLVPESRRSRQDVKASIGSQFWEQPVHSTKSVDGQLWSLPCEPPALNLTGSSGLSRTQQLIAAQAVRVPFFPSYDGTSEGLVLDRVLVKTGGRRWWAALSGRVKAQRVYNLAASGRAGKLEAARNLSNYALCARGRFKLGRRLTLDGVVEAPDTQQLQKRLAHTLNEYWQAREAAAAAAVNGQPGAHHGSSGDGGGGGQLGPRPGPGSISSGTGSASATPSIIPELEPCTAHATLRCTLPGHDLCATAGYNLQYVDSTGDVAHVPLAASLDLASHDRPDGLQYRVGLHQVTAPPTEGPIKAGSMQQRWRTSLYAQGAVAVEGEAHIWKAASGGSGSSSGSNGSGAAAGASGGQAAGEGPAGGAGKQQGKGGIGIGAAEEAGGNGSGAGGAGGGGEESPRRTRLASAIASAAAADEDGSTLSKARRRGKKGEAGLGGEERAGDGGASPAEPAQAASDADTSGQQPQHRQAPAAAAGPAAAADQLSQAASAPAAAAAAEAGAGAGAGGSSDSQSSQQTGAGAGSAVNLEDFMRPLEQMRDQVSDMLHHYTHPDEPGVQLQQPPQKRHTAAGAGQGEAGSAAAGTSGGSGGSSGSSSEEEHEGWQQQRSGGSGGGSNELSVVPAPAAPRLLGGLSSHTISATIADSLALLQQVKESVERLTGNVQDGSLQRLSQQLADSRGTPQRRRPYSLLLAQPHLKLNAALGCLARMPLPALRAFSFPHASLEPLDWSGGSGGPSHHPTSVSSAHNRHGSSASLMSRASYSSQLAETWQPYLKGTALRVFASAGVSGQLGRFTRPWLDYTAASARIDVGLTSPHVVGVVPDPSTLAADSAHRPDKHRAFALEGRGSWHALSVSLAQQVLGPVRARLDARFALDPTSVPEDQGERSTLKGVLQTALSVRPSLLETVYGFDVVLPGTEGAARMAVWFSPKRRECMAELRLF